MTANTVVAVKTEETPNPNTLKYNFSKVILPKGMAEYSNKSEAEGESSLAKRIFEVTGVEKVLIGTNFISITKLDGVSWEEVNSALTLKLEEFFESNDPAVFSGEDSFGTEIDLEDMSEEDKDTLKSIENIIQEKIRPALMADGGNIDIVGFKNKIVYVKLQGACYGCPSAKTTLKDGVERTLKHYLGDKIDKVTQK
ncbi:MAG: NifU family protein [Proteobacteria bacterium]|nr:NifU family protein [Pseudomonadota bacterium]